MFTCQVAVVTKCDVTKEEDISALGVTAREYADSSGSAVWGVVNNAGKRSHQTHIIHI